MQLASLPLIGVAVWRISHRSLPVQTRWPLGILAAVLLLPLVQLVPLPPDLWSALPGREQFAAAYRVAGMEPPWLPLSLDGAATWRAELSLLPAVAIFLATLSLNYDARRRLSVLVIAVGFVAVVLGLAQIAGGSGSPLRFYPITNPTDSVGFFANRNHHAAFLYSLIAFVAAWMFAVLHEGRSERTPAVIACVLILVVLLIGLGMARSRAGLVLALAAIVASALLAGSGRDGSTRRGWLTILVGALLGTILIVQFALERILSRFDVGAGMGELRLRMTEITLQAGRAFAPFGTGFGTFEAVYQMFDRPEVVLSAYVNHAHNDWAELWLEGGVPAMLVAVAFLAWYSVAAIGVWRGRSGTMAPVDRALARAASIAILLLLAHSAADYPLRTTAMTTFLAFACGLLVAPVRRSAQDPAADTGQRRVRNAGSARPLG
ncbi:O-antigen ligase family protein [Microbaculum marinum]|uniref:O-antigen ligase family protein n=1 Tax=Microbaculum marinum TaxID=1764581 RepID=A0AAW9RZG5_9HYPH